MDKNPNPSPAPAQPRHLTPEQLKTLDHKVGVIRLLSGQTEAKEDFFAYVSLRPSTYEEFCRNVREGKRLDVEKYGKVLHSGFGIAPSEDDRRYVEEQFGIDHNFVQNLMDAVEQESKKTQAK